jgi:hypothetical protein
MTGLEQAGRGRFDRTNWIHIQGMAASILLPTTVGWLSLVQLVAPGRNVAGRGCHAQHRTGADSLSAGVRHGLGDHASTLHQVLTGPGRKGGSCAARGHRKSPGSSSGPSRG